MGFDLSKKSAIVANMFEIFLDPTVIPLSPSPWYRVRILESALHAFLLPPLVLALVLLFPALSSLLLSPSPTSRESSCGEKWTDTKTPFGEKESNRSALAVKMRNLG